MTTMVDSVNNTAARLHSEGYNVAACALRAWIRDGSLPASKSGIKALLYYPLVLARIKSGKAVTLDDIEDNEQEVKS